LPPSFALWRDVWRVDLQNTTRVFVQAIANFLRCRAFLFLNTHGEALAVALSFYFRGQIALHIRTAIRRVMLLIALVVSKHINAIEIRFVDSVRRIRTTLLEYQPASGFCFASCILVGRTLALAVESLPRHKLASRAIKNNVTRHRELNLFSINPTSRRRRRCRRQPHFVPELVRFFRLVLVTLLPLS